MKKGGFKSLSEKGGLEGPGTHTGYPHPEGTRCGYPVCLQVCSFWPVSATYVAETGQK